MVKELKYRDVAKSLRGIGWSIARTRGSHEVWKSPDGVTSVSVVAHGGKVSPGVVRDVIAKVPDHADRVEVRETMSENKRQVEAIAKREGGWWEIDLPVIGTRSAARKLRDVQHMAEEAAAVWLDVEPEALDVHVSVQLPEAVAREWELARQKAERARADEAEAAALSRSVVRTLQESGYTQAEAAQMLGLSPQRIHQLVSVKAS